MRAGPEPDAALQRGFRFALALTHDGARAEDLLQDAVVAILRAGGEPVPRRLLAAVRERFLALHPHERLVVVPSGDDPGVPDDLAVLDEPWPGTPSARFDAALAQLRPQEREALYLASVEGCTVPEIAALTERPRAAVASLVVRAREKMRGFLGLSPGEAQA